VYPALDALFFFVHNNSATCSSTAGNIFVRTGGGGPTTTTQHPPARTNAMHKRQPSTRPQLCEPLLAGWIAGAIGHVTTPRRGYRRGRINDNETAPPSTNATCSSTAGNVFVRSQCVHSLNPPPPTTMLSAVELRITSPLSSLDRRGC
jgi:hypothetical protein